MPVEITVTGADDVVLDQVATDGGYPVTHQGGTRNRIEQVAEDAGAGAVPWVSDANAIIWLAENLGAGLVYRFANAGVGGAIISEDGKTIKRVLTEAVASMEQSSAGPLTYDVEGVTTAVVFDCTQSGEIVLSPQMVDTIMASGGDAGITANYRFWVMIGFGGVSGQNTGFFIRAVRDGGYDIAASSWGTGETTEGSVDTVEPPQEVKIVCDAVAGEMTLVVDDVVIGTANMPAEPMAINISIDEYKQMEVVGEDNEVSITLASHTVPLMEVQL